MLTLREHDQPQTCACGEAMEKGWAGKAPGITFKGRGWTPRHYTTGGRR